MEVGEFQTNYQSQRFEVKLVRRLWPLGPVVTIGQPSEKHPLLGAARDYASNDNWQPIVTQWMNKSAQIILIIGKTPSLDWEFSQLVKLGLLQKLVVVIPPLEDDAIKARWSVFCRQANDYAKIKIPPNINFKTALMLFFNKQNQPILLTGNKRDKWHYHAAVSQIKCFNKLTRKIFHD